MFDIIRKSLTTGIVTTKYPQAPAQVCPHARGRPEIDFPNLKDAPAATAVCPTGAFACQDNDGTRTITLDLGNCTFCGLCADADPSIRMTNVCELAARSRAELVTTAEYQLSHNGGQPKLLNHRPSVLDQQPGRDASPADSRAVGRSGSRAVTSGLPAPPDCPTARPPDCPTEAFLPDLEVLGAKLKARITKAFGRSLHIREVDAGSCNGCEIEIVGLNSPVYDIERFGIHFVASPRHADLLLVTGPVSRNMELALRKTYQATPPPRLVVAVGACAIAGGMFGRNYATVGGVDKIVPVDVYIPGCPPNPYALLHGILKAIGKVPDRA